MSRADQEFKAFFLGRSANLAPAGVEITEGPFAAPVSDPVAFRKHQAMRAYGSEPISQPTEKRASRRVSIDSLLDPTVPSGPPSGEGAVVTPALAQRRTAETATVKMAYVEPDIPPGQLLQAQVSPQSISGGAGQVSGLDVGELPGPDTTPMVESSAPSSGKRGPTPNAQEVTSKLLATLRSKGKREGKEKSAPLQQEASGPPRETKPKEEPGDDGNRVSMDSVKLSEINSVLRTIGVPPSAVRPESVLFQAVSEKVAELSSKVEDSAASYLTRDDAHPMSLWMYLGNRYGDDWLEWDAEVIQQTLEKDIGVTPSDVNMNKMAAMKLVTSNPGAFFGDWRTFEKVCLAFDGHAPRLTLVEDLSPEQMALGVGVMRMLQPTAGEYSMELRKYCAARLFDAGFVVAPPELGFADEELKKLVGEEGDGLRKQAFAMYLSALHGEEPRDVSADNLSPEIVQAGRLMRVHAYVLDKIDDLLSQTS